MPFLVDAHRRRVPAQNVERSICIGVDMEAAMPTNKDRLAFAALSVNGSAFRTGLRCVCGIDLAQVSAAFFGLVGKDGLEAEPALIEDRAVQSGLLPDHTAWFFYGPLGRSRHVFDAQIFQNNRPKAAGKIERGLVRPIAADARSTGRELRGASQRLRSTDGATLASRHNVLCGAMASFDGFERARHGHALTRGDVERVIDVCGKRQRIGNAAIDADARADIDGHICAISRTKLICQPSASRVTVAFFSVPCIGRVSRNFTKPTLGKRTADHSALSRLVSTSRP